jgi:hypothetical protein
MIKMNICIQDIRGYHLKSLKGQHHLHEKGELVSEISILLWALGTQGGFHAA